MNIILEKKLDILSNILRDMQNTILGNPNDIENEIPQYIQLIEKRGEYIKQFMELDEQDDFNGDDQETIRLKQKLRLLYSRISHLEQTQHSAADMYSAFLKSRMREISTGRTASAKYQDDFDDQNGVYVDTSK